VSAQVKEKLREGELVQYMGEIDYGVMSFSHRQHIKRKVPGAERWETVELCWCLHEHGTRRHPRKQLDAFVEAELASVLEA